MNNLLLWLAGILILALGTLFVVPHFVDWNSYRVVFEEQATRLAGRKVTVEGNVNLRLLPAPYVSFGRVRIGGDDKSGSRPLLEVEDYTLWLAVPPLLKGEFEAQAMEIGHPVLRLALQEDGTGQWSGLGRRGVDLPFVPRKIAFNATHINGGRIELVGANGKMLTTVDNVTGTLSAGALTGPYKFVGSLASGATTRELRWSTGRMDENGALRIKGTVKDTGNGTTYAADGLLQNLMTKPVFVGAVAGKFRKKDHAGFEMKMDVYADTSGARLSGITLLLDAENRPQIINGSGQAEWQTGNAQDQEASATIELNSRWLDIDRLVTDSKEKKFLSRIDTVQTFLASVLPTAINTTVNFVANQVNFGGESLDDVQLKLVQRGTITEIETLSASVPGASRIRIDGRITSAAGSSVNAENKPVFDGTMTLHGRTLKRFANWLDPSFSTAATIDGPFALASRVTLSQGATDGLVLDRMRGTIRDMRFTGRLQKERGSSGALSLDLKSTSLDLARFFPDVAALGTAVRSWRPNDGAKAGEGAATNVKLDISQVTIGTSSFADVAINARLQDGAINVTNASFASAAGLTLALEGENGEPSGTSGNDDSPKPIVQRFVLRATSDAAYDELKALTGYHAPDATLDRLSRALLPAHLAGSLETNTVDGLTKVRFDGTLAGNPAVGRLRIDGTDPDWHARTWNIVTDIALGDPDMLLRQTGFSAFAGSSGENKPGPGVTSAPGENRLVAYAIGKPRDGLKTSIGLRSKTVSLSFAGPIETTASGLRMEGELSGRVSGPGNVGNGGGGQQRIARILGLDSATVRDTAFSGHLIRGTGKTVLRDLHLTAGESSLAGSVSIVERDDKQVVEITADADTLSLPGLLAVATKTSVASVEGNRIWSGSPFDFSGFDDLEVEAKLHVRELRLGDGLAVLDATLDVAGTGDIISVSSLEAVAAGGKITASGALKRRPAGAGLTLAVQGRKLAVAALAGGQVNTGATTTASADGTFDFDVSLKGLGLSPAGMISVMTGRGQIEAKAITIPNFSPQVVQDVAADVAEDDSEIKTSDLKSRLANRLGNRPLDIGAQTIAFHIRDGVVQADNLRVETDAATITTKTYIDIAGLRLDSEWRIKPNAADGRTVLPPVTVFYASDIGKLSHMSPGFGVAALERELAVRRLEGNIDRLEGLRSLRLKPKPKSAKPRKSGDASGSGVETSTGRLRPTISTGQQSQATRGASN